MAGGLRKLVNQVIPLNDVLNEAFSLHVLPQTTTNLQIEQSDLDRRCTRYIIAFAITYRAELDERKEWKTERREKSIYYHVSKKVQTSITQF